MGPSGAADALLALVVRDAGGGAAGNMLKKSADVVVPPPCPWRGGSGGRTSSALLEAHSSRHVSQRPTARGPPIAQVANVAVLVRTGIVSPHSVVGFGVGLSGSQTGPSRCLGPQVAFVFRGGACKRLVRDRCSAAGGRCRGRAGCRRGGTWGGRHRNRRGDAGFLGDGADVPAGVDVDVSLVAPVRVPGVPHDPVILLRVVAHQLHAVVDLLGAAVTLREDPAAVVLRKSRRPRRQTSGTS